MEVVQFFSNVFPILQVTLSSMRLDNHDIFTSLVLTVLGAWVPEGQAGSGYCLWKQVGCLVLPALKQGKVASWCHGSPCTLVKSVDSDSIWPEFPFWCDPSLLDQVGQVTLPLHAVFFFNVLGNTLKSPLLCSISSHYRTYRVTIYSFLCHFSISFSSQKCKQNARIFD